MAEADDLREKGDLHAAMLIYRECLEYDKSNVNVLNTLGACLWDVGNELEALSCFELAYSLDDSHIPAVTNYAKVLIDKKRTREAVDLLEHAVVCWPEFSNIYTLYASVLFARGEAQRAKDFYLRGWLGNFDSLRMANGYFFPLSYVEEDQRVLAAEHRFWAETMRPINLEDERSKQSNESGKDFTPVVSFPESIKGRRIRIGYWSPDLRDHSVRYFFRPMLEGHDRDRFEIFLYHDSFITDAQTSLMRDRADHFHDVYLLNDVQIFELIRSHQLDIIVEMAGHTSANRLTLFGENRFATLQVTGVGYPPTTGLSSIDAKLLDRFIAADGVDDFYAENPMILPSTFWCFDPLEEEDSVVAEYPPFDRNGYITFACVGNISKISDRMLAHWVEIMRRLPTSRLLIRSISFADPTSKAALFDWFERSGLDMSRVDIRGAEGGAAFFQSYNDIDIVLDTYPFNGGTTTCFATYMGVPVVSLVGDAVVGRMGLSIMANLGAEQWIAEDDEQYVEKAVNLAADRSFLRRFKLEARTKYKASPLGNGRLFMAEFESACESFLLKKLAGIPAHKTSVPALPSQELMRRAYSVANSGNLDAAQRILNHCLAVYPHHGGAHTYVAQQMAASGLRSDAIKYLNDRIIRFEECDQVSAIISVIRWLLLDGDFAQAAKWLAQAQAMQTHDRFDSAQLGLYKTCLSVASDKTTLCIDHQGSDTSGRITVVIPCEDENYFDAMSTRMREKCLVPDGWSVTYVRCDQPTRGRTYKNLLKNNGVDVLLIMQRVVEVVSPTFYLRLLDSLDSHDVVSVAGANRWVRSHWRGDKFEFKSAGFFVESSEQSGFLELQCLGVGKGLLVGGQSILDGVLLAVRVASVSIFDFDDELGAAGWALEEDWTHAVGRAGARLAVHRNLGVLLRSVSQVDRSQLYPGLLRLQEKYKFPLFSDDREDGMVLSLPLEDVSVGLTIMDKFCKTDIWQ